MKKYALVLNGVISQFFLADSIEEIKNMIHTDLLSNIVAVPKNIENQIDQTWLYDGSGFYKKPDAPPPLPPEVFIPVPLIRERMQKDGTWERMAAILQQNAAIMLEVLTLREGISVNDERAKELIRLAGSDPETILLPLS